MKPDTHASLQALEKELERLRSAVEHIDQAKSVAQKVVGAVGLIQKKYSEHLDALLEAQRTAAEKLGEGSQQRFDEINNSARRHILESAARAKKYLDDSNTQFHEALEAAREVTGGHLDRIAGEAGEILESAGSKLDQITSKAAAAVTLTEKKTGSILEDAGENISRLLDDAGSAINRRVQELVVAIEKRMREVQEKSETLLTNVAEAASHHIREIGTQTASAVEDLHARARHHVDEVGTLSKSSVAEIRQLADTNITETSNQSKKIFAAIKKTHDQQLTEFEKVTVSTDALIAASGKLVRTIDSVDFPARLQSIENDIRSVHYNLNTVMARMEALEKSNENAMEAFGTEVSNKLGRLESFTDKTIRTMSDGVDKQFAEQQKQLQGTRMLIIVLLIFNILLSVGLYLVWSGQTQSDTEIVPVEQPYVPPDSLKPAEDGTGK
ncbi:apolipoprotein A1/A4/E family protein [bacterium]|nr:apolipoprotein A1/A4/E family protein [bacterium]